MADTIFAFATGEMRAAIAVMRVSGPAARKVADVVAGGGLIPRMAAVRKLRHPVGGDVLDEALAIWFPGPASFTGEDCLELHVHGGGGVRRALVSALLSIEGCRSAQAGEFTRRAFLNGKLDLVQVEGLGDLLSAETELQRRQAVSNFDGGLSRQALSWRAMLLDAAGLIEAVLDFADEGDAPDDVESEVRRILADAVVSMERELEASRYGELIQRGARVVISGPPNAGKSSLLNALARRDVAIVTDVPGTTRDLLEVRLDVDGLEIVLVDTAGVRETADPVESIGVARALAAAREADLVVRLYPADGPDGYEGFEACPGNVLPVISKCDLLDKTKPKHEGILYVSTADDATIRRLIDKLRDHFLGGDRDPSPSLLTNLRQVDCVVRAVRNARAAAEQDFSAGLEIAGFHVRGALSALSELAGAVGADDVLDVVFAKFCMGK